MKNLILITCCIFWLSPKVKSQSGCTNSDFELNNFSNWNGSYGAWGPYVTNFNINGIVTGRHTIMSGTATDPNTGGVVPVVCPGGLFSARLGNDNVNAETEKLTYNFTVTPQTNLFIYKYAVVLQDGNHPAGEQPRFIINVYDQNQNLLPCGGSYNVYAQSGIPGFATYDIGNGDPIRYKNWSSVGIDCSALTGQVTIEFITFDCVNTGHFGYAYIDAYCSSLQLNVDYCVYDNSSSLSAPEGFENYLWSNGATTKNITVSNPTNGATYACTVTSYTGCSVTISTILTPTIVHPDFITPSGCFNNVMFIDSSKSVAGQPVSGWEWNFGDGSFASGQNQVHAYAAWGNYIVQLITTTVNGCKDTINKTVHAFPLPKAGFSVSNVCLNDSSIFLNTSTIDTGSIVSFLWKFGDATQQLTSGNAMHIYTVPEPYDVMLITTSDQGCTSSVSHYTQVYHLPEPDFFATPVEGCQPLEVTFTDQSTCIDGQITNWSWNYGSNQSSSGQSSVYIFNTPGLFDVMHKVISSFGCVGNLQKPGYVLIHPLPDAGFRYIPENPSIFQPEISFVDESSGAYQWFYNFGDHSTSTIQSPQHNYLEWGSYQVSQVVTSEYGCLDTIIKILVIDSAFACYIPNAFTPNGDGINDYFFCNGIGVKKYELNVYNRWGQLIYNGTDRPWDGKNGNDNVPEGGYVYQFFITDIFNRRHVVNGMVSKIH